MTTRHDYNDPNTEWIGSVQTFVGELIATPPLPPRKILLNLMEGLHSELRAGHVNRDGELECRVRELLCGALGGKPEPASIHVVTKALQLAVSTHSDFASALQSVLTSQ